MARNKIGKQTIIFRDPPRIISSASVVGPMEGRGPLGKYYDVVKTDTLLGQKSWEQAECRLLYEASDLAIKKARLQAKDVDFFLAGDLLNQIVASTFVARDLPIPFLGLYGACATMTESMAIGAMMVSGGYAKYVVAGASSHHDSAERQYRYPTELGNQRVPTSQWTVTGAGAVVLGVQGDGPRVTHATIGKVVDMGLKDPNDMGSAMAPAAAETIWQHFQDTGRTEGDYDLIITGDLASVGKSICEELLKKQGHDVSKVFSDCALLVYSPQQDVHAGASGCACSAVVLAAYLMKQLHEGELDRVLLVSTGSLHSPTTYQQGESIPAIAHAVAIENQGGEGR